MRQDSEQWVDKMCFVWLFRKAVYAGEGDHPVNVVSSPWVKWVLSSLYLHKTKQQVNNIYFISIICHYNLHFKNNIYNSMICFYLQDKYAHYLLSSYHNILFPVMPLENQFQHSMHFSPIDMNGLLTMK